MMLPWKSEGALHCTFTDFLGLDVLKGRKKRQLILVLNIKGLENACITQRDIRTITQYRKCMHHQLKNVIFNTAKLIIQKMQNCSEDITIL